MKKEVNMNEKIVLRKVISLTMALSFLVMSFTGLVLFSAPRGNVANWVSWDFLGLTRIDFVHIHMTTLVLFLFVAIWHIYNNWGALVYYLENSSKKITLLKKEFLISLAITLLFVIGAIIGLQPFQSIITLNDGIKSYWEKQYDLPPFKNRARD